MIRRSQITTLTAWLACLAPVFAGEEAAEHGLPLHAEPLWGFVNNSTVMVWVAVLLIVSFCRMATGKMSLVPSGLQNFAEWVVESLYDFLGGLLGEHLVRRTFWFFGSVFFFIIVNNYLGLMPGVGTVGWMDEHGHMVKPLLRGGNADPNMTAAMSAVFAVMWFVWAISENGLKNFLAHIFAPKGHFNGIMKVIVVLIFLFVGVLEVISICVRPVALTFRLYGNIYGGENTMEKLMELVPHKFQLMLSWLPALPFCFMELLVGFVQALVFTLLGAVFLKLICDHGEEAHH